MSHVAHRISHFAHLLQIYRISRIIHQHTLFTSAPSSVASIVAKCNIWGLLACWQQAVSGDHPLPSGAFTSSPCVPVCACGGKRV